MDNQRGTTMNVYQRINEIRKAVAYIRKDKRVENYTAVTHDAVTAETREHFIKHGVLVIPHEIESAFINTGATSAKGTPSMRFEAKYRIDFVNIDDPADKVSVELSSHALDFGDKAPGKAHSYAVKYALLKVLQIETGDQEEGRETISARPGVDDSQLESFMRKIEQAADEAALKSSYMAAIKAAQAVSDKAAQEAIIAAKDKRKADLAAKAKASEPA